MGFRSWDTCIFRKIFWATLPKILLYFQKSHTPCHLIIFERLVGLRDFTAERGNFQTILLFLLFFSGGEFFFVFSPTHLRILPANCNKEKGKDFPRDIFSYWCLITRRNSVRPRKVWFRNFIIYATFCFFFLFSFFFIYSSETALRSMT